VLIRSLREGEAGATLIRSLREGEAGATPQQALEKKDFMVHLAINDNKLKRGPMKSEMNVDLRTPYCGMLFKRSPEEQMAIRQKIVRYAQQHGNKPAARHYGCDHRTVRDWRKRFEGQGAGGLKNKSRAPHRCPHKTPKDIEDQVIAKRKETPCYGPRSLKYYYPSLKISEGAIYRILKENGLLRKHRKKYLRKQDLREAKARYRSLTHHQEDVKHLYDIPEYWPQMTEFGLPKYEYTIRDTKSGFTIVAFANEYSEQYSTMLTETYLNHLKRFGVDVGEVMIQTDNGSEFGAQKRDIKTPGFVNTIAIEYGAHHQYIPPGCSNANADVESFHATVEREFFNLESFRSREEFFRKAQVYQSFYNFARINFSKRSRSLLQIFLEDRPGISPEVLNFPVYDLDALFRQKMELPAINERGQYVHKLPDSPSLEDIAPSSADLRTWIATLPMNEKDDLLANVLAGSMQGDQTATLQQVSRFTKLWRSLRENKKENLKPRTVEQLLKQAELVRQNRKYLEAERKAAELAEKQRLQKIAREKRLNEIMGQEPTLWTQIESLASEKKAKSYDKAVELLTDLRDLAARGGSSDFHLKLNNLREKHSPKSSFIERLRVFS
jgi:transposase InsO family protein